YFPGSFDRPPRNPAEKINSGYKAWECLLYLYGLGPALFHGILPAPYWKNYCQLFYGIQLIYQHKITREQLIEAHQSLNAFTDTFEELYYQRKAGRIHFCRLVHRVTELNAEGDCISVGEVQFGSVWASLGQTGNQTNWFGPNQKPNRLRFSKNCQTV
ncbi:hypothetical protein BC826DRAFT_925959, partial [Russula brevipes]